MRTDITRNTFDAAKNFSRVLNQQGRVQLDADWNEQVSILLHYLRALAADVIGQSAGPNAFCGFELIVGLPRLNALLQPAPADDKVRDLFNQKKVLVSPGRYYVDGLLVENRKFVSFFHQPHFKSAGDVSEVRRAIRDDGPSLVYLDVWERQVTFVEDDSIREKALGGADSAARAQVVWRVRRRDLTSDENVPSSQSRCLAIRPGWEKWKRQQRANRGKLRARVEPAEESDDPCAAGPESAYRGLENQLYRVEIHHEGRAWDSPGDTVPADVSDVATFKWSRDNGSVFAPWLDQDGDALTMVGLHDRARGFENGQWIELSDEEREMTGKPGILVQVRERDRERVMLAPASEAIDRTQFSSTAVARRWDQEENEATRLHKGAIPVVEGKWFALEDGVQVYFEPAAGGLANRYRTGDYWLIPARVATRNIEWPREEDANSATPWAAVAPHGIKHHYAPLGILSLSGENLVFEDCRCKFDPVPCAQGYPFDGAGIGLDLL
jgi:hypothetical protein